MVKIISVNCQGLGDIAKRKDVFSYLRALKHNIYCLQDTHFSCDIENEVRNMWGYQCFFSSYSTNSRGVAILVNNNFDFKPLTEKGDVDGNYLLLKACIEGHEVLICNVYGPNNDNPLFFDNIQNFINDMQCTNIIWCGDFNLVLNPDLDYYNYKNINNPKARDKVLELIENNNYIDPFRQLHENIRRYSWRKKTPLKQSRLDFFLISQTLLSGLEKCNIESSYRSDHSMISLSIVFNDFKKGRGLWKFNNSLLYDENYLDCIKNIILAVKKQYAIPVYNFDNIHSIPDASIAFTINDQLFLETLLMEIRGKTISYASYLKKKERMEEKELIEKIKTLEENACDSNIDELSSKKQELENIRKHKLQGNYIRSRAKWVEEGEKPSKYFCALESRNFTNKIIPRLENTEGRVIYEQSEILGETKTFYEKLYKKNRSE